MTRARFNKTQGRFRASAVAILAAVAASAAACGGGGGAATTSTTTSTLPPLPAKVFAYVALAGSGGNLGFGSTMVQVDLTTGSEGVGQRTHVGTYPDAVAVTPDGRLALVANFSSNTVTPVELPSGKALPAIDAGAGPAGIAITPNGSTAYVTDDGSLSSLGNTVTPIDLTTMKVLSPITVGDGPQGIVITPDGSKAFVADDGNAALSGQPGSIGHQVTPIDLATGKAGTPINVGNGPLGIAVTPDGSTVYVTNLDSESVSPINVSTMQAGAPVAVEGGPLAVVVGHGSAWVVDAPAVGQVGNNLQPILITTNTAGKAIALPKGAQGAAVSPNGLVAWVVCLNSDRLSPVNLVTRRVGTPILIAGGPVAVAVADQPQGPAPTTTTTVAPKKKKRTTTTT